MTKWQQIQAAVELVQAGAAKRIDGDDWKVYRVVDVIRIDIPSLSS
jgi:hypothetical protein